MSREPHDMDDAFAGLMKPRNAPPHPKSGQAQRTNSAKLHDYDMRDYDMSGLGMMSGMSMMGAYGEYSRKTKIGRNSSHEFGVSQVHELRPDKYIERSPISTIIPFSPVIIDV